jgi:hypothetical protein
VSVYFITCRDAGAVKIGHSVDPHGRLPEVQLGCPLPLKVEAWVLGGREEEMAMHWRFSEHRIHGEWFHLCDEIELVITGNPAPAPPQRGPKGGIARRAAVSSEDKNSKKMTLADQLAARDHHKSKRFLQRLETRGDICFPFRAKEPA